MCPAFILEPNMKHGIRKDVGAPSCGTHKDSLPKDTARGSLTLLPRALFVGTLRLLRPTKRQSWGLCN